MGVKIKDGRIKPKKESTFAKKPFKGKDKNRKGSKKKTDGLGCEIVVGRVKPKFSAKNVHIVDTVGLKFLRVLKGMDLPCFVCGKHGSIELHHIKEASGDTKNHRRVLPLCGDTCHRLGLELSAHGTPKKFREIFPMEMQYKFADKLFESVEEVL